MSNIKEMEQQDNAPMNKNGNLLTPLFKDVVCSYLEGGVSDLKISNISFEGIFNKIVADENVRLNTEEFRNLVASGRTEEAKQKKILQCLKAVRGRKIVWHTPMWHWPTMTTCRPKRWKGVGNCCAMTSIA